MDANKTLHYKYFWHFINRWSAHPLTWTSTQHVAVGIQACNAQLRTVNISNKMLVNRLTWLYIPKHLMRDHLLLGTESFPRLLQQEMDHQPRMAASDITKCGCCHLEKSQHVNMQYLHCPLHQCFKIIACLLILPKIRSLCFTTYLASKYFNKLSLT